MSDEDSRGQNVDTSGDEEFARRLQLEEEEAAISLRQSREREPTDEERTANRARAEELAQQCAADAEFARRLQEDDRREERSARRRVVGGMGEVDPFLQLLGRNAFLRPGSGADPREQGQEGGALLFRNLMEQMTANDGPEEGGVDTANGSGNRGRQLPSFGQFLANMQRVENIQNMARARPALRGPDEPVGVDGAERADVLQVLSGDQFTGLLQRVLAQEILGQTAVGGEEEQGGQEGPMTGLGRHRQRRGDSAFGRMMTQILLQGMGEATGGMSYEQLVALQERMGGAVNRGLSAEQIETLPVHTHQAPEAGSNEDDTPCCSVCLDDFAGGDKIRALPCAHTFHSACIDQW
eukprot:CAMPEP_0198210948 /NCGR_PEP_ID=MMETSP1445-20131203/22534_1 /TAXON_ID=36898 /ORGANISM="Pyramimonas sp., Strain CCMP2087" /LENGTH=352 /DNA_ID=CAMNT_0043885117 /DNA_START=63 /DNA_END=1118 /DNA_ORIENTATION=-